MHAYQYDASLKRVDDGGVEEHHGAIVAEDEEGRDALFRERFRPEEYVVDEIEWWDFELIGSVGFHWSFPGSIESGELCVYP